MKVGTPGFIPSRLQEARAERGLSGRALAERIGASPNNISLYERGTSKPLPDKLEKLCAALNVPASFFLTPVSEPEGGAVFYRAQRTTSVAACNAAEARLRWLHRLGVILKQWVNLPRLNLPPFEIPADPLTLPNSEIERMAVETRRFWKMGLGPISNVVWLLENNGILLSRGYVDAEKLDGLSQYYPDHAVVLLAANKGSGPRSRFDAAHELGHLILHRNVPSAQLNRLASWKALEEQAHRFASAFLFPEEAFRAEVRDVSIEAFLDLKMRWKASAKMMLVRAERLGFVTPERAERLHINYGRRKFDDGEPLDDQIPPEQPRLLRRALEILAAERGRESLQLPFAMDDVVRLTGVSRDVLTGEVVQAAQVVQVSQVVALPRVVRSAPAEPDILLQPGELLRFPTSRGPSSG